MEAAKSMIKDNQRIERYRVTAGPYGSSQYDSNNGVFVFKGPRGLPLVCIVSDGLGWDHVSVHVEPPNPNVKPRLPTWEEMCAVKDMFWGEEETVIQYHPPKSSYKNVHPYVLHLWRPQDQEIPMPELRMV